MNFRLQVREKNEEDVEFIAKPPCRPEAVLDRNAYLVDGTARRRSGLERLRSVWRQVGCTTMVWLDKGGVSNVGSSMVDSGFAGTKKSGLWFWLLCCGLR
jgi:hypothetical protein